MQSQLHIDNFQTKTVVKVINTAFSNLENRYLELLLKLLESRWRWGMAGLGVVGGVRGRGLKIKEDAIISIRDPHAGD
jgi:hypothetical protein